MSDTTTERGDDDGRRLARGKVALSPSSPPRLDRNTAAEAVCFELDTRIDRNDSLG